LRGALSREKKILTGGAGVYDLLLTKLYVNDGFIDRPYKPRSQRQEKEFLNVILLL
jgi:hypothetical protein